MKIGILTLGLHFNYGGILQAYALQHYLQEMGHEVWLINNSPIYKFDQSTKRETIIHLAKLILGRKYKSSQEEFEFSMICTNTSSFIRRYINPVTAPVYNKKDYNNLNVYHFDAVIVGSDQVWSKKFGGGNNMLLEFVGSGTKKIAYAASFGEDKWLFSNSETTEMKKLITLFRAVSVREDSGVILCKDNLGIDALHVIDPTMLLKKENYMDLCKREQSPNSQGNILLYLLDEHKLDWGIQVANYLNLIPFSIRSRTEDKKAAIEDRIFPPVTDWIKGFSDAEYIVTDSFHGCVFSIIFNKPFIVIEHGVAGNARIQSLLKMFELENRMIYNKSQITEDLLKNKIDFEVVNERLTFERHKATDYIINALS